MTAVMSLGQIIWWMEVTAFADTPKGAHASAVHYSLIETCKANGLNPDEYYREILAKLPYADTVEKWEALLPWNVKANFEKKSGLG